MNADRTFLEHGDAQVLFTLRMGAAHYGLGLALLRAVVTHRQDLDLTVVLLKSQAVHRCSETIEKNKHRGISAKTLAPLSSTCLTKKH